MFTRLATLFMGTFLISAGLLAPQFAQPVQAVAPTTVVIHKPGTPQVVPSGGITVDIGAGANTYQFVAGDSYGAFAIAPIAATTTNIQVGGKTYDVRQGKEIWLATDGTPHPTRAKAQGFFTVYVRTPGGGGTTATLDVVDLSTETSTSNIAAESNSTDTEAIFKVNVSPQFKKYQARAKVSDAYIGPAVTVDVRKWGEFWLSTEFQEARYSKSWADGFATFHYNRPDGKYFISQQTGCELGKTCTPWGMHVWAGSTLEGVVTWQQPKLHDAVDDWGLVFKIPLAEGATTLSYLFHQGDTKDPSGGGAKDQSLDLAATGGEVWYTSENFDDSGRIVFSAPIIESVDADLTQLKAIWVTDSIIGWPESIRTTAAGERGIKAQLLYSEDGSIQVSENEETREIEVSGYDTAIALTSGSSLPSSVLEKFRHLNPYRALNLPAEEVANVKSMLRGQVAVLVTDNSITTANPSGATKIVRLTGIQLAPVLDYIYASAAKTVDLGIVWSGNVPTMRVWAPTAQNVKLVRYQGPRSVESTVSAMTRDASTGVWSVTGDASWKNQYFVYEVDVYAHSKTSLVKNLVPDPYSISLSMNSTRSQIFDPSDLAFIPAGWNAERPAFTTIKDATIYELHVRDFSVEDSTVSAINRGKYLAFSELNSAGMKHLKAIADAGMTHLHLLPVFDIATIDEDSSNWQTPGDLGVHPANSEEQQKAIAAIADKDGFNWGYDPYHFNAPEGSYAVNPDGGSRILEFRQMIKGLSDIGLRNVLDVVYNHTNSSGQNDKSTFDKIVPGYYFRLSADGSVTTSTCCQNTATEHEMMYKFTRDSILSWVKYFKIDGFRFDLMGHMPKALLVDIRADLDKLTIASNGVDGKSIILYGEGWNFGEVQNGARFVQATQGNMAGTGIAVFDDRLRDSAKGGGPFDSNPTLQGYASSSWSTQKIDGKKMKAIVWNGDKDSKDGITRTLSILSKTDLVKLGLVGTLRSFGFKGADGFKTSGTLLKYNGNAAGYNLNPTDMIAYVDKHDNEALFDWLAYKLPQNTSLDARLRHQVLALSISTLGQGVPFYQAGSDIMRSKSLDKNSYNSGDWFNAIRWDLSDNGFGRGLPMKGDNGARWDEYAKPLLAKSANIKPTSEQMRASTERFQEFLQIRYSSELFRLATGEEVKKRIRFASASGKTPGVIAMMIQDGSQKYKKLPDLDPNLRATTVIFNTNVKATKVTISKLGKVTLHPVQQNSVDSKLKGFKVVSQTKKTITVLVPALSTIVLNQK